MTTFGDLVHQVSSLLHSYTGVIEQATWLTAGCAAGDLSLAVNSSDAISNGISEIDDELVYVTSSDSNVLTIAPFGRGYRGTTAASHSSNARVTFAPMFPRAEVKRALNQCLSAVYPQLYQIKTATLTFSGNVRTYSVPADVDRVLRVTYQATGPSNYWPAIIGWEFEPTSSEATGKAITFLEPPQQGRTVRVVYQANFTQFAADTDTLASVGFPESAVDVLLYGASAKLIRYLDAARLQIASVENNSRAQVVQAGDAGKIANQMYAMYQQRINEERKKLLDLTPPTINFQR